MSERLALGLDLGGTKIAAGVFSVDGARRGDLAIEPSCADEPADRTLSQIAKAASAALESAGLRLDALEGVGLGAPGPYDPEDGRLVDPTNLPHLTGVRLRDEVAARVGAPTRMTNDANCFVLAEASYGAGVGERIVLGVTLGTGCGVGIAIGGRILEGTTANAGEVYRAIVEGETYDAVLSGPGLEAVHRRLGGGELGGGELARLAAAGDAQALASFAEFGRRVGLGLGVLASVVDPGVIVLGGSVSRSLDHYRETLLTSLRASIAPTLARRLRVEAARLGEDAGCLGAAALVFTGGRLDG